MENFGNSLNPLVLIFTISMGIIMLFVRREYALIPFLAVASFITLGQSVIVFGAHLDMTKILILFGSIRILIKGDLHFGMLNRIDKAIILWISSNVILNTLLFGTAEAFVNRIGYAMTAIGSYFIARALVKNIDDAKVVIKGMAILLIPLAIAMLYEKMTLKNLFYVFGGVPEYSLLRDGQIRSQGSFLHPILAGTFGATLFPLFISLYWSECNKNKTIAICGIVSAIVVTWTSRSSGPLLAFIFGTLALFMWRFRFHMRFIRRSILLSIIALHLVMKAPVWYVIGRLSQITGGSGWHRSDLIDSSIRHINEWWLFGTTHTRHWMPTGVGWSPDQTDITNMFIRQGVDGGLLTMILFIMVIVQCYKALGRSLTNIDISQETIKVDLWCMGSALFAHMVSFISVAYFDQMLIFWIVLLAMIASVTSNYGVTLVEETRNMTDGSVPCQ
jgi:hypothetical protein